MYACANLWKGIAAIDMGAGGGPNDPVYPYHSNYDSYHWMATFGDPGTHYMDNLLVQHMN